MKFEKNRAGSLLIVKPSGRLDSHESESFEEALRKLIEDGDNHILLDLSEINYVSSRGLRVFISTAKWAQSAGGRLAVCSPQGEVKKVLDMTGLGNLFGVFATSEEAIQSFESDT
jgi:anti-anti-sigma factor